MPGCTQSHSFFPQFLKLGQEASIGRRIQKDPSSVASPLRDRVPGGEAKLHPGQSEKVPHVRIHTIKPQESDSAKGFNFSDPAKVFEGHKKVVAFKW